MLNNMDIERVENNMESMVKAKIIKVLEKDMQTPKNQNLWMQHVKYSRDSIRIGLSAAIYYSKSKQMEITSHIEGIKEDENNLILTTENSIYYIKKLKGD